MSWLERLGPVLKAVVPLSAAAVAVVVSVLKHCYPAGLEALGLHPDSPTFLPATTLTVLGLVAMELCLERILVLPKLNTLATLEKKVDKLQKELGDARNDLAALSSAVSAPDRDLVFATLVFKFSRARLATVLRSGSLEVAKEDAYSLWRDCVQDSTQLYAVSFALDAWGPRASFSAERCQLALVKEHGHGAVQRVFLLDGNESDEAREVLHAEIARQRDFCANQHIRTLALEQYRALKSMNTLKSKLSVGFDVHDLVLFRNHESSWLYVTELDDKRSIKAARVVSNPDVHKAARDLFSDAFELAKRSSLPPLHDA